MATVGLQVFQLIEQEQNRIALEKHRATQDENEDLDRSLRRSKQLNEQRQFAQNLELRKQYQEMLRKESENRIGEGARKYRTAQTSVLHGQANKIKSRNDVFSRLDKDIQDDIVAVDLIRARNQTELANAKSQAFAESSRSKTMAAQMQLQQSIDDRINDTVGELEKQMPPETAALYSTQLRESTRKYYTAGDNQEAKAAARAEMNFLTTAINESMIEYRKLELENKKELKLTGRAYNWTDQQLETMGPATMTRMVQAEQSGMPFEVKTFKVGAGPGGLPGFDPRNLGKTRILDRKEFDSLGYKAKLWWSTELNKTNDNDDEDVDKDVDETASVGGQDTTIKGQLEKIARDKKASSKKTRVKAPKTFAELKIMMKDNPKNSKALYKKYIDKVKK